MFEPAKPRVFVDTEKVTVVKITSAKAEIVDKLVSELKNRYCVVMTSRVKINPETQLFFCFVDVANADILGESQP